MVLGDVEQATEALRRAALVAGGDLASLAVTRCQLRLVCDVTSTEHSVLAPLSPPAILHLPAFVHDVMGALGGVLDRHDQSILWRNS